MIIRVRGSRVVMKAPPLKYILIVAKPKEHYLESSKATGAIQLQNKISDRRRDCGGDRKAILTTQSKQCLGILIGDERSKSFSYLLHLLSWTL